MALGRSDIRNLFFSATGTPITQVDSIILASFVVACGDVPTIADAAASNAAQAMI